MSVARSILWRRLDAPGHDACRIDAAQDGWVLRGMAAFEENGAAAALSYRLDCDAQWRSVAGRVAGWLNSQNVEFVVRRGPDGIWSLNGRDCTHIRGCFDLDFGFTPATNLTQLRRIDLAIGASAQVSVAWLNLGTSSLEVLRQTYQRRSENTWWYEAERFDYRAVLVTDPFGFIQSYPNLWEKSRPGSAFQG